MTLTENTMEWLDRNRYRAYPMKREPWREKVSPESRIDGVLLDAMVFDGDAAGGEDLYVDSVTVSALETVVSMSYGNAMFSITLSGGDESGPGSYDLRRGSVKGAGLRGASVSLAFSSHAYILSTAGEGSWSIGCPVLKSRVASMSHGMGVDGVHVNGSQGVDGRERAMTLQGDVVLEDGYRTSPVIADGRIMVRVGTRYGLDPCFHDFGEYGDTDCSAPLMFFCGQNAINSGNIVIKGGKGISVSQGRSYKVSDKSSKCNGMTIPCIEIIAGSELLDIANPPAD